MAESDAAAALAARPSEDAALYNPAFIALLLAQAAAKHAQRTDRGLPFSLVFLAAPIVLHGPTRRQLPRQERSKMAPWLEAHPLERAGAARRATRLVPAVRSGLRYGLRGGQLELRGDGLVAERPTTQRSRIELSAEVAEILSRAAFVGGWFGLTGPASSIYALWRVRP